MNSLLKGNNEESNDTKRNSHLFCSGTNIEIKVLINTKSGNMPNSTYRDHADMRIKEIHERQLDINIRKRVKELMEEYSEQKHII